MDQPIFDFDSYKTYLKAVIAEKSVKRGFQAQLARAAGCQGSYLIQSLRTKVELTPDHGARIAVFLGLSALETDYLLNLIHLSRAISAELRALLRKKLEKIRSEHRNLSKRIAATETALSKGDELYYSSWIWMAVHAAISVERFGTVEALSSRLGISESKCRDVLQGLENMGLAHCHKGRWSMLSRDLHLTKDHYMNGISHRNWRDRANLDAEREREESVHYTSAFTISRSDADNIRALLLEAIERSRTIIKASPAEELYCLLCDFFVV